MGQVLPFRQREPEPGRRPRVSARAMGLNPRALGLNPRALAELSAEQVAERIHLAAELARTRATGQLVVAPAPRPAAAPGRTLRRPLAMAGCPSCGGTGWAEAEAGAVAECPCRDGVLM